MGKHKRPPLIMRIPRGIREQPAWIFIGFMFALVGVGYATGLTHSSVAEAVGNSGLRMWGVALAVTGLFLVVATAKAKPALEKFSLRVLSCNLVVYTGWLVVSVPINRAASTLILSLALVALSEFRVMHLSALIATASALKEKVGDLE